VRSPDEAKALIDRALAEDVGTGDLATEATVPSGATARATITQKAAGVVFGLELAEAVFARLDPGARFERLGPEAEWREPPAPVLAIEGDARALLTAERTALNLLQRLSGVATLTARHVRAIEAAGGTARVIDTRKTTPGLRALEKAAVVAGGGLNHRVGLHDGIILKENHATAAGGIAAAVRRAHAHVAQLPERGEAFGPESRWAGRTRPPIEVEVRDPREIDEALTAGAEHLLLDNMSPEQVRGAVAQVGGRATLEASGGIDLESILVYATIDGLDYVSVGALTHSAPALDLSLLLEI
jgi:nicotinate-nucleotide pyrophosphorylase (carboxylating)